MALDFIIREGPLEDVLAANEHVPEFEGSRFSRQEFETAFSDKKKLILVAYSAGTPVGFLVGYERNGPDNFWFFGAATLPEYRRRGIMNRLFSRMESWALQQKYTKLECKTRNYRREMLNLLLKTGWNITQVLPQGTVEEYKILFEKRIA